jgi:hypothetical protein
LIGGKERALASKHTARNLLAAAFSSVGSNDFGNARGFLERADREVARLREEGCDDIDVPKKKLSERFSLMSKLRWKRKESKQEEACDAPERRRPMKFLSKALVLLALPVAGALAVQHSDKIASVMPDLGTATRAEFQIADACVSCQALSDHADTPAAFCKNCGATEVKQIVAAKLHAGFFGGTHVGWQLQDGQTLLLHEGAEYEVPPLRVKSDVTKTLTRF